MRYVYLSNLFTIRSFYRFLCFFIALSSLKTGVNIWNTLLLAIRSIVYVGIRRLKTFLNDSFTVYLGIVDDNIAELKT